MPRITGGLGVALLLMTTGVAAAQNPIPLASETQTQMTVPAGYAIHESLDIGGRIVDTQGSSAMYDTLVNQQTGPRLLNEAFEMHALPGKKNTLIDDLSAFGSGFGGDPYDFAKLDFSKGKIYEFSGVFHRDRQFFDYDLLGNPGIPSGSSIPETVLGTPNTYTTYPWPQVMHSPVAFNTVRRMTDTSLTLYPLSKVTFKAGYAQNVFEGPSLTPGESVGKYDSLLQEYQRHSTDDFTGEIDWKPVAGTQLTFEEEITHDKENSYFTIAPSEYMFQEAGGPPVSVGDWDSLAPYSASACNSGYLGWNGGAVLVASQTGGAPIINPYCDAVTSYLRSQPTRILTPSEIFRFQSTSIKNITMNGDFRYTSANMNLPNYYENIQGLNGQDLSTFYTAKASAKREVTAFDYGVVWQAVRNFSLSDQIDYSNVHQPGRSEITADTSQVAPTGDGYITYSGQTTPTSVAYEGSSGEGSSPIGVPAPAYFGQRILSNDFTGTWDATPRATFSLTYHYRTHVIAENEFSSTTPTSGPDKGIFSITDPGGNPGNVPLAPGADTNGTVTINENGGIFNAALRPTDHWDINGTAEVLYDDNAFTPVGPRQTKRFRVHTKFTPKPWATIWGSYNDQERHNNTNSPLAVSSGASAGAGPLDHVDHSRVFGVGADLAPNEHYGLDLNYGYSDVYSATNICFDGAATAMPGGASVPGVATPTGSLCAPVTANTHGGGYVILAGPAKDFEDAPTQYGSVSLALSPVAKLHSNLGYRISSVNGSRFFTDAMDVNGSMVSTYQTPFVNLAYTIHPGLILKADYDYFGYGEGGRSGAQWCANNAALTSGTSESTYVEPCSSLANTAMSAGTAVYGATAPRNFHANNVTLAMHYDF